MSSDQQPFDVAFFESALDALFEDDGMPPPEVARANGSGISVRTAQTPALPESMEVEPETVQVMLHDDIVPGPAITILADSRQFELQLERDLHLVESLLGLTPGRSMEPIPPGEVLDHDHIRAILVEHSYQPATIKPDQADPLLERLPMHARAGEIAHMVGAIPYLVRLQRLRGVSDLLKERGDEVIREVIAEFIREPVELYAQYSLRPESDFIGLAEIIEGTIDTGMERMAGPHGHWDRRGRWPAALLFLQSLSLACLVAGGVNNSLRELSMMQRQYYRPEYFFLNRAIDTFYQGLKNLRIYDAVVQCSNM